MSDDWTTITRSSGLLIDTNLLVLFVVGSVSRSHIQDFKRTKKFSGDDYDLLKRVLDAWRKPLYTVPHVLAEVSNLTDMGGHQLSIARRFLKETITVLREPSIPSLLAAQHPQYERLGLTDAAIARTAHDHDCAVLTDDLQLHLTLGREGIASLNFAHLQAKQWRL